ncbi:MAG: paiB [Spartobacteria bacterium]|nr:paiB [Spartobacteria bacterium]
MYVPSFNRVDDRDDIAAFIHAHGFATLITHGPDGSCASHLPVLFDQDATGLGRLRSHMARANGQWRHLESGEEVLCIFHGPHAYISPSWYVMQRTVPTWNYATAHVYGVPTIVDATALQKIVYDTTDKYESGMPNPWKNPLTDAEIGAMLKAIVGFSIEITCVEVKFKLGQNRSTEDQESMLQALQGAPDCASQELAQFIIAQHKIGPKTVT